MTIFILLTIIFISTSSPQSQPKPGCPPPVSEFVSYPTSVEIPRVSPIKVATLIVRENSYFGTARCSLLYDLSDPRQVVYRNFKIEERSLSNTKSKVKECDVWLTDLDFQDTSLEVEVILIVSLDEGYREYCDTISSTAKIQITFCDPSECLRGRNNWEIIGNVVNFKNSRSVEGNRGNFTTAGRNKQSGNISVGEQAELDRNNKLLLGLTLVVTLVAFSLILGLIYFWCPSLCCCMSRKAGAGDLNSTKILTVRDSQGRVIQEAKTVDVWKTRGNTLKTLNVIETASQSSIQQRKYSKLESETGTDHHGMKVINVGDGLDGLIILRKPDQSGSHSRMTLIEEINPRTLRLREEGREEGSEGVKTARHNRYPYQYENKYIQIILQVGQRLFLSPGQKRDIWTGRRRRRRRGRKAADIAI